jgi:hypothetical protein
MMQSPLLSPYQEDLARVMPSVFVAGPAKSGSTFLWECIHQTFHPERICGGKGVEAWSDAQCRDRFVLPAVSADAAQPACLRFEKESSFWRYWGRRPQMTWQRYGGPRLPLSHWELHSGGQCSARRRNAMRRANANDGPRKFAGHRAVEDACLQDVQCPAALGGGGGSGGGGPRFPYSEPLPASCHASCEPCAHHPGWMNNYDEACAIGAYKCASRTCANAPYVPKALRRQNFSAHHKRLFTLTAYPSLSALSEANISARRLASIEGNPGIFQTPPRHARALKALTTHDGQHALRLIVGLRDPFDLAFSLWSFLSAIGQEGKRVEVRMGRALAAIQACNDSLAEDPTRLLQLTASELEAYRLCLDDRPRSRQHFYLYGGLYGLHLLGWLHLGYRGSQFLFVRMKSLPREFAQVRPLQTELASFLDLPKPPATMRRDVCLSATMVTSKRQRLRAHNATVADVKRSFKESSTARSLAKFLAGHDALLQALIAREKVRVY